MSTMMRMVGWLRRWPTKASARGDDVERELQAHLDLEAEELRDRGFEYSDAIAGARKRFGNTTSIREEIREMGKWIILEQLVQDLRFALRTLAKSPGFAIVALASLALGIGANTAIFTFVNAAFLKPLPYPEAARIVALRQRPLKASETTLVHPRSFVKWRDRAKTFESMALAQPIPINIQGIDGAEQVPGLWMTPDLFGVFAVQPFLGREFSGDNTASRGEDFGNSEIILGYGYWQRRFGGDRQIVGKRVALGRGSAIVVGVMPAGFGVANLNTDVYSPMRIDPSQPQAVGSRSFLCFGRIRSGLSMASAKAEMALIASQVAAEDEGEKDFGVAVLGLREYLVSENRSTLFILSGIVGFVLLIACVNLASLLLTRGLGRQNELAVRAALGAGRWRIVQQLGVESLLLSVIGGALGLFLGLVGSRALASLAQDTVDLSQLSDAGLDGRVLAFTFALSCVTALLFGLAPAWQASRIDLQSCVKAQGRGFAGGKGQSRIRSGLVIGEVALAVVLLVCAGLLLRTFANLVDVKLGFQPDNAITMRTLVIGSVAARSNLVDAILDRVELLPGVKAVGTIQFLPLSGMTNRGAFHFVGQPSPADPASTESDVSTVSRGYFAAIGMELLRGRAFTRDDRLESRRVAIVNQSFVSRYARDQEPIGRTIVGDWADPKPTEIVGVVNDIRHNGVDVEPRPTVFLAQSQTPGYITYLVVRTASDPTALAAAIRREVRQVDPTQPLADAQPLRQYVSKAIARPRLYANFLSAFASLGLFLAAIGLYGLLAYAVSQRTHEIGLRMALGAQPADVLTSTIWQGVRLVTAGLLLGIASAYGISRLLARLLYGVQPFDPLTYVGVAALLPTVALLAAFVPARRAAAVDPIVALRYE